MRNLGGSKGEKRSERNPTSVISVRLLISPVLTLPNADGTISILIILHDITERKQAELKLKESEQQLHQLSSKLLSAQEDERRRIALEVHDVLGSALSAIKFKMEDIIQRIHGIPVRQVIEGLENIFPVITGAIEDVRRIQIDLRPPILDDLGIVSTLSWFCRRFEQIYSGIEIEKSFTLREEEVPEPLKISLLRVTQEAMHNIVKHARADKVHIGLRKIDGALELFIRDNGEGFDPENLYHREISKTGMGLSSMKERTEISGGSFSIESSKGKGTVIRAVWPV